ncbi:MAG: hypothetical protein KDG89_12455 [Geminicoccaceae bacterium]|nr:hypothetical protein [Geminicoccaceae bacterium]
MQPSRSRLARAAAFVVIGLAPAACAPASDTGTQQGAAPIYPGEAPGAVAGPDTMPGADTKVDSSTAPVIVPGSPVSEPGVF